jgi:tetratricopeptide (TPR) repeat protein
VEILTRLGAALCRLRSLGGAKDTFERARRIDPTYAPRLREEARCRLQQGEARRALELGVRAVALDPGDEEASIVVARAYAALGDGVSARRWLDGLAWFRPGLDRARAVAGIPGEHAPEPPAREVDRALALGRLGEARQRAQRAGIEPAELGVRAVALGRIDLGRQQAALVLAADPSSADAWVAALVAADLGGDDAGFVSLLGALDREAVRPGRLGSWLFAELLARRVDSQAARAWLDATLGSRRNEPARDELVQAVVARVEALIGGG